jgi:DNA-binding NarL/FixJ family response regulator
MPRKILLIEHDTLGARAFQVALSGDAAQDYCVVRVTNCSEGVKRLLEDTRQPASDQVSAIAVDLCLPDSEGIETFDRLFRAAPQIPVLILSRPADENIAKLAIRRGAQDYLLLGPIDGPLLVRILNNMVERAAIVEELYDERERAQVTLNSIGDSVITTDLWDELRF